MELSVAELEMLLADGEHGGFKPMRGSPALLRSSGFKTGLIDPNALPLPANAQSSQLTRAAMGHFKTRSPGMDLINYSTQPPLLNPSGVGLIS
jgi:hypothetical protein